MQTVSLCVHWGAQTRTLLERQNLPFARRVMLKVLEPLKDKRDGQHWSLLFAGPALLLGETKSKELKLLQV